MLVNAQALTASLTTEAQALDTVEVDLIGCIVATAIHADTTVTAKIQTSCDNVTWFDLIAFTAITDTSGSEIKIPTSLYGLSLVRASVALSGSTLQATVTLTLNTRKST